MVYTSVSMKSVMAMVIRHTRVKDTSYIMDLDEWIAEAMSLMRTRVTLSDKWYDIDINFHKGNTPKGCRSIAAIEWNGHRIPRGNSVLNPTAPQHHSVSSRGTTNGFEFVPQLYPAPPQDNPEENGFIPTYDLRSLSVSACNQMPCLQGAWYTTELNYITLSIPQARIRLHGRFIPVDDDGLPLIPDNGDYKHACYLYCRAAMIGAGFEDKVFTYQQIMNPGGLFEVHAARAMGSIRYPSVDSMEFKVNEFQRLIKDENYFNNFFSSPHPERVYGYDNYLENLSPGAPKTFTNGNSNPPSQGGVIDQTGDAGDTWQSVEW